MNIFKSCQLVYHWIIEQMLLDGPHLSLCIVSLGSHLLQHSNLTTLFIAHLYLPFFYYADIKEVGVKH